MAITMSVIVRTSLAVSAAAIFLAGCVGLDWSFAPGSSSKPGAQFAEPPFVVHRRDEYFLAWTYGKDAFFFLPGYEAINGRLVFTLQATSSTGNLTGRCTEMKIEGPDNLLALKRGGAYWWEPDGSYVPLRIVEQSPPTPAIPQ